MSQPPAPLLPESLQLLPPKWAHFCLGIERFCREELPGHAPDELIAELDCKSVLVALSAGADSTALVLALHYLAPKMNLRLAAAHLDHGLRPESPDDADAAELLCRALAIPFYTKRSDVAALAADNGLGLEEAGREARYEFLEQTRQEAEADLIATGHTLNDLAEDLLMRLMRGAGWPGLGGMRGYLPERRLFRPLLLTPKASLTGFLTALGCPWREDSSNNDRGFLRNRVRHDLLPLFLRENPNFLECAADLWRLSRLDAPFFQASLPALPEPDAQGEIFLSTELIAPLSRGLRLRLFKAAIEALGSGQPLFANLMTLDRVFDSSEPGKVVQFPGGKRAVKERGGIRFTPGSSDL